MCSECLNWLKTNWVYLEKVCVWLFSKFFKNSRKIPVSVGSKGSQKGENRHFLGVPCDFVGEFWAKNAKFCSENYFFVFRNIKLTQNQLGLSSKGLYVVIYPKFRKNSPKFRFWAQNNRQGPPPFLRAWGSYIWTY